MTATLSIRCTVSCALLAILFALGGCASADSAPGNALEVDPFSGGNPELQIGRAPNTVFYLLGGLGVMPRAGLTVTIQAIEPVEIDPSLVVTGAALISPEENGGAFFNATCGPLEGLGWVTKPVPGTTLEKGTTYVLVLEVRSPRRGSVGFRGLRVHYTIEGVDIPFHQEFGHAGAVVPGLQRLREIEGPHVTAKDLRRCAKDDRQL